ncbi:beta-N-acetylhexosaminidase [Cysteiniphilum halobium]|uniref:beta-N-acetylhexosaminidase n=1 Tax=Cysteiniphilum halobium TaxID=2219059 RepID=UPI000E65CEEA|nr:beta-N-acetylhexosaminidase [Cysteiniphilum halobium]
MHNNSITARFIIGIESTELTTRDITCLQNKHVVGVILFSRNFVSSQQLQKLTTAIKSCRNDLIICVDQEGGRVQRFSSDQFTPLSSLYTLAQLNDMMGLNQHVETLSTDLKNHGIDFSFTPVVDLYNKDSRVINTRAFAKNPKTVILFAKNYIDIMRHYGLPSVLKHFPGHGSLLADSHTESVIDKRSLNEIEQTDLLPFITLIKANKADSIMIGHLSYPQIDHEIASQSSFWLNDYLRHQLHFGGIIFSDDFGMFAATTTSYHPMDSCRKFFHAGGDIALLCNEFRVIDETLNVFNHSVYQDDETFNCRWQRFQQYFKQHHLP